MTTVDIVAWLRQRDGVTCGPSVAVMAGALLDEEYGAPLRADRAEQWFATEQGRVHRSVNLIWPRVLGTTPAGMVRAFNSHNKARYRWRPVRRHDGLHDVCVAVKAGWPVAMLVGSTIPRHWVLLVGIDDDVLRCYDPAAGRLIGVPVSAVRDGRVAGLGFPRPFAFVLPRRVPS